MSHVPDLTQAPLAIITGASSGIGEQLALRLAERGYRLLLLARSEERLRRVTQQFKPNTSAELVALDMSDLARLGEQLPQILAPFGRVSLLINNAGSGCYKPFLEHSLQDHQHMMNLHYHAAVISIRTCLPAMLQAGHGQIINIASMSSKIGPWGHAAYAASKAALVSLTQTLAAEYAERGITFSYVNPGIVDTAYFQSQAMAPLRQVTQHRARSVHFVADRIVRLLDHPQLELCIPHHYRWLDWLTALSPSLAHAIVSRYSKPAPTDQSVLATTSPKSQQANG